MSGRECYHCKQWVEPGEPHDCWTTTEAALTRDLSPELREAWERLRETAVEFGEQRIYASHHSIMFSRRACYFFVRPKQKYLELCVFLHRLEQSPRIRKVYESSTSKRAHMLRVIHRDEVEAPLTDWLREAYECADPAAAAKKVARATKGRVRSAKKTSTTKAAKRTANGKPHKAHAPEARRAASDRPNRRERA